MGKDGKRVGKTPPPRSMRKKSGSDRLWWWLGGAAAVVLLGAAVIWMVAASNGAPVSPPPPVEDDPVATPAPTEPEEPSDAAPDTMPENTSDRNDMYDAPPETVIDPDKDYVATIVTEKGDIVVELDAAAAPETVNNFVFLAESGFYDGLTFHRVEPGFVIQGGDPLGTGAGGPGYTIPAEIELSHEKGAIAMARRADQVNPERASSGSQFYITLEPTPFLDGAYTVFGEVVDGTGVVDSIAVGDLIESIVIHEQ